MRPQKKRVRIVERFLLRRDEQPALSVEEFCEEAGPLGPADRSTLAAYLRAERALLALTPAEASSQNAAPEPDSTFVGRKLGGCVLERVLGRGGSGTVFRARDLTLDRPVALKVLHPAFAGDTARIERFRREGAALARLDHPHIVPVHAAGEAEGLAYLVMPLIEGISLEHAIAARRTGGEASDREKSGSESSLATAEGAATLAAALADALEHAHALGIIHRDVKPGNVLLDGDARPFLVDFGLACDEGLSRLTESGDIVGTPSYMAPEQLDPTLGPVDGRTDVFGLGVTLFELLTTTHPFLGASGGIPSLRRLEPNLSRDLETIALKAIDPDPRRRYATAAAFRDDLRRFLAARPIAARRVGPVLRAARWARRRPARAAAAVVVLLLAAIVIMTQAWAAYSRERQGRDFAAAARAGLQGGDPRGAVSLLARARELGVEEPGLLAKAQADVRDADIKAAFDEARAIVFERDAGESELERAQRLCAGLPAPLSSREIIEREFLEAAIAFRRCNVIQASIHVRKAAKTAGIPIDTRLVADCLALARRVLGTARGGKVVRSLSFGTAIDARDRALAQRLLSLVRRHSAEAPEAGVALGILLHFAGLSDDARSLLDSVLEQDPRIFFASWVKAYCYADLGRDDAARETANAAVVAAGGRPGPYYLRGSILTRLHLDEAALADFDRAISLHPGFANAVLMRAGALTNLGRDVDAEDAYARAVELAPDSAFVRFERSQYFQGKGRYVEALKDLNLALRGPEVPVARLQLARAAALNMHRRYDEAVAAADLSIAADSAEPRAYIVRSEAKTGLGRHAAALHDAETAARLARRLDTEDREGYAAAAAQAGQTPGGADAPPFAGGDAESAIAAMKRQIEDDNPFLRFDEVDMGRRLDLALAHAEEGNTGEALRCLLSAAEEARAYAAAPPPPFGDKLVKQSLIRAFERAMGLIQRREDFEALRSLPESADVLATYRSAIEHWR